VEKIKLKNKNKLEYKNVAILGRMEKRELMLKAIQNCISE